jgi:glycosyl transferase, family 25
VLVYVINRRARPDRRAAMERQLASWPHSIWFTSDWEGVFDWESLTPGFLSELRPFAWQIDSDNPWWSRPLKLGEIACALAHEACWLSFLRSDAEHCVILEDDAVLLPDFADEVALVVSELSGSDWDFCYLGRLPIEADRAATSRLVRPGYSHCTYAYMLSRVGGNKLVSARLRDRVMPIDEFIPALYTRHPRADVAIEIAPVLVAFAVDPPLVRQRSKDDAGSDTEDSPFLA